MSVTTPVAPRVHKAMNPSFPDFAFEWHEHSQKVYAIANPGRWEQGRFVPDLAAGTAHASLIGEECDCLPRFKQYTRTFLCGILAGANRRTTDG